MGSWLRERKKQESEALDRMEMKSNRGSFVAALLRLATRSEWGHCESGDAPSSKLKADS